MPRGKHDAYRVPGYESLALEIVKQAADDYRSAVRVLRKPACQAGTYEQIERDRNRRIQAKSRVGEIERFFRSKWFGTLAQGAVDPEQIICGLHQTANDRRRRSTKR